jgi:hypothetical protein
MSFFDGQPDTNILPTAADGITAGPQTGFAANFQAAAADAYHVRSAFAAQEDMANLEQTQLDALYKATGTRLQPVFPGAYYNPNDDYTGKASPYQQDIMHVMAGDDTVNDQMRQEYKDTAQAQIAKYDQLAQQHGLLTYEQMFKQVQQNAQQTEATAEDVSQRSTFAGEVGGFLGGAAGSMTQRDPINLATLALGGVGKTFIARVASQIGLNGLAQAAELLTGSADTQKLLLGKGPTAGEEAMQIAAAGLGAGALHVGGEAIGAGYRALVGRFGAAAPDIASAALAKEADEAIGKSPYGDSRVAQGLHTSETIDTLRRDRPLNQAPDWTHPEYAVSSLTNRNSDQLFSGTSQPLRNLFDDLPKGINAGKTNGVLTDLTSRIDETSGAAKQLDDQITARTSSDAYDPGAAKRTQAQLTDLNARIADTTDKRTLGQLNRDKVQLEVALTRAEAVNSDLKAMIAKRDGINQVGDALRLQRAQTVADAVKGKPGIRKSAVASTLLDGDPVRQDEVATRPAPSTSDAIEQQISKPAPEPTPESAPKPRIITPEPPKQIEGQPAPKALPPPGEKGSGEMVEVGQRSGAIDMDTMIPFGRDADGNVEMHSVRDILKDLQSHDDLYKAMTECMI